MHVSIGGNASLFPDFIPGELALPVMRPVATPRTAPESYAARRRRFPDVNGGPVPVGPRLGGRYPATLQTNQGLSVFATAGHLGCSLMERITMSLKTVLESGVEQSMKSLVRVSFEAGDEFLAVHWPSLCDLLFDIIRDELHYVKDNVTNDRVDDGMFLKRLERLNDTCVVIRNMSLQVDNARRFATVNTPKDILVEGLNLPSHPSLAQVKSYFLDMAAVMAGFLPFAANDPLLEILTQGLESPDRGTMLGSIRAMCRFIVSLDDYNRMADIPVLSIRRITSILVLEDEELISACLVFLYQYTLHGENIKVLLAPPEGYELVRHLVRLLLFQGTTGAGEQFVYIKMVKKGQPPSYDIPHLR
jgi:chromatin structure-remodeling complex subunit RSC9